MRVPPLSKRRIILTATVASLMVGAVLWFVNDQDSATSHRPNSAQVSPPAEANPSSAVENSSPANTSGSVAQNPALKIISLPGEELANLDTRRLPAADEITRIVSAQRRQALEKLKAEYPGVKVTFDPVSHAPDFVGTPGFVMTGGLPGKTPQEIVRGFLQEHAGLFGHGGNALDQARLTSSATSPGTRITDLAWQQELNGIPVFKGILQASVTGQGELMSVADHFMADPESASRLAGARREELMANLPVSARQAVVLAAADVGDRIDGQALVVSAKPSGPAQQQKFSGRGLLGETDAQLTWFPMGPDELRLGWSVTYASARRGDMFWVVTDASTGKVIFRQGLTFGSVNATFNVYANADGQPFRSARPQSPGPDTPPGVEAAVATRQNVTRGVDTTVGSNNGWFDDDLTQTTFTTAGNNVKVYIGQSGTNGSNFVYGNPYSFSAFATRPPNQNPVNVTVPVITPDFGGDPTITENKQVAAIQLFYVTNWMHDQLFTLGFTEAAGNFQNANFSGGTGGDRVNAFVQPWVDKSGGTQQVRYLTNSSMSTPPADGGAPLLLAGIFDAPDPDRDSALDNQVVLHEYAHGLTQRRVGLGAGITALQTKGMGEGWSDFYALALLANSTDVASGNFPMGAYSTANPYFGVRRYPYSTNANRNPLRLGDIDLEHTNFPTGVPIQYAETRSVADRMALFFGSGSNFGMTATVAGNVLILTANAVNTTISVDAYSITHQGSSDTVAKTLVRPASPTATQQIAVTFPANPADSTEFVLVIAGDFNHAAGVIAGGANWNVTEVHYVGEVWCSMLWDMRDHLISQMGFTNGSQRALQLVTAALSQPGADPGILDERDKILAVDRASYGGENVPEIWAAFAKRGAGNGAVCSSSTTTTGFTPFFSVTESFNLVSGRSSSNLHSGMPLTLVGHGLGDVDHHVTVTIGGTQAVAISAIPDTATTEGSLTVSVPSFSTYGSKSMIVSLGGWSQTMADIQVIQGPASIALPATSVTNTTATLNGTINPNGNAVTVAKFEYGTSIAYGNSASVTLSPNNGTSPQSVSASLGGLQVGTLYHYRLSTTDALGTTVSSDATFSTTTSFVASFSSLSQVPITASSFTAGGVVNISLGVGLWPSPFSGLTLVNNTGASPISGTFSNLPEGGLLTTTTTDGKLVTFQASYHGGDGNDLVLTRVPNAGQRVQYQWSHFAGQTGGGNVLDGPRTTVPSASAETIGPDGSIYFAQGDTIRKITPEGYVLTIVGNAGPFVNGQGLQDGSATTAILGTPRSLFFDGSGNLIFADTYAVRKMAPDGTVSTIAGSLTATSFTDVDGNGTAARFGNIVSLATYGGYIYAVDGHGFARDARIRKIAPNGDVTTIAGNSGTTYTHASDPLQVYCEPGSIAFDSSGNLYLADSVHHTIRKFATTGQVSIYAGVMDVSGSTVGVPRTSAKFYGPSGFTVAPDGTLYVTDDTLIRKVPATGNVTVFAGSATVAGFTDGQGTAARFSGAGGIYRASNGDFYVSEGDNYSIRIVSSTGAVTTFSGQGPVRSGLTNGVGAAAEFDYPVGVLWHPKGFLLVADKNNNNIRKIMPDGTVSVAAGSATGVQANTDGVGTAARFYLPDHIVVNAVGDCVVSNYRALRKIVVGSGPTPTFTVSRFAGSYTNTSGGPDGDALTSARFGSAQGLVLDSQGNYYVTEGGVFDRIRKVSPSGGGAYSVSSLIFPNAPSEIINGECFVATDELDNIYLGREGGSSELYQLDSSNNLISWAGGGPGVATDGPRLSASFLEPKLGVFDPFLGQFVLDYYSVRLIDLNDQVSTLVGTAPGPRGEGITGSEVAFYQLQGIAYTPDRTVYVSDTGQNRIVRGIPTLGPIVRLGTAATATGSSSADLDAFVTTNGTPASVWFEYGTTTALGQSTSATVFPDNAAEQGVTVSLSGLTPATVYYFRFKAQNSDGTSQTRFGWFRTMP